MFNQVSLTSKFIFDESGQGITEYGGVLAFVAIIIAFLFANVSSPLRNAISNAFSSVAGQLNNVAGQAAP